MPTFNNGESGSSVREKINDAIEKAELAVKPYATRTAAVAALGDLSSDITIVRWLDAQGDVVEIVRDAGSTVFPDMLGWKSAGVARPDHFATVSVAIQSGLPLDFGSGSYTFSTAISRTLASDMIWYSRGAKLTFTGTAGTGVAHNVESNGHSVKIIGPMHLSGGENCHQVLKARNGTDTRADFIAPLLTVSDAVKSDEATGAYALEVQGLFWRVDLKSYHAKDCYIASEVDNATQSLGVCGVLIKPSSNARYPHIVDISGAVFENIYAEDTTFTNDQDGARIFGPDGSTAAHDMHIFAHRITGVNCIGRTLKSQAHYTEVNGARIHRDMTVSSTAHGIDIDVQTGGGFVKNVTAVYQNGNLPATVVLINGTETGDAQVPYCTVSGVNVTNETTTDLSRVLMVGSRDSTKQVNVMASEFGVIGGLDKFARIAPTAGTTVNFTLSDAHGSLTGEAVAVEASSSGEITLRGVRNTGTATSLVNLNGHSYTVAAQECIGFNDATQVLVSEDNIDFFIDGERKFYANASSFVFGEVSGGTHNGNFRMGLNDRYPFLGFYAGGSLSARFWNDVSGGKVILESVNGDVAIEAGNVEKLLLHDGGAVEAKAPVQLQAYTVATLPSASAYVRSLVWVSDETGGAQAAFSNGTNWLRVSDGATVS